MKDFLVLSESDNIAVVINSEGIKRDAVLELSGTKIKLIEDINYGHKFSLRNLEKGESIIKYGQVIGIATKKISVGEHVHVHNIEMPLEVKSGENLKKNLGKNQSNLPSTFWGYERKNGRAGIRNYIAVVATVNCSSSVVKAIVAKANHLYADELKSKNIDKIVPIAHTQGCAQAIDEFGYSILNKTLAGHIFHPNVVASLVIGLGCEGTTWESIAKHSSGPGSDYLIKAYSIQDSGGTEKSIELGLEYLKDIIHTLPSYIRKEVSVSNICLALNCGGSDALSGLTANPLLGLASDYLVSYGATSVLAEIPECHGAENYLRSRCVNDSDREKMDEIFNWWNDYAEKFSVNLNNNLSPGNIKGGISTIIEKSLGAVAKGGSSSLNQVLGYSEQITKNGFCLMNTPGFDPVSVTGLVAGGCNIVAFTTGRGSVFASPISPTIKIATNSALALRMSGDIDFNAGELVQGASFEQLSNELFLKIISICNGEKTKSEILGIGAEEFVPWAVGETL
jgi:altronate dehydratase